MPTTPTRNPPRLSAPMPPASVEASERELVEQLQAALAPSFVLVRRLGAGGMGVVYLARDPALKRLVAVKVMLPERAADPEARARFEREAESVAAISHPNVVAVYSVGELANGLPYLVMQYVDGPSMADRLGAEGPLDLESAKSILGQVAAALGAAHRKGIIHRDIKAANILWDDAGGRALVSDFGIAAVLDRDFDTESLPLTQAGVVMGTPRYMSPEQLLSEPVTDKSDIYSLGLLGYELLTGEGPYGATAPNAIVAAHLRDAPKPLSKVRPDADPELEALLASCLEKDPNGRPGAEDVARRLERGASVLLEWPPPGLEELQGAIERPATMLLGGALAVVVPLLFGATVGRETGLRLEWPQVLLLPALALAGGGSGILAVAAFARVWRQATRAAKAGYSWGTIAEVLVDENHDGGALIAGDREFAALTPAQRTAFRRGRLISAGLRIAAGFWAVAGFFVTLPLATRLLGSPAALVLGTAGVPLIMLLAAKYITEREWTALRPVRARIRQHRRPLDRLSHLASTWRDAFERIFPGAGLGQGRPGRTIRKTVALVATTVAAGVGVVAAYGLMTFLVLGEIGKVVTPLAVSRTQDRVSQIERLRALRPTIDPSITPLRAGEALHSLNLAGNTRRLHPIMRPPANSMGRIPFPENHPVDLGDGSAIRKAIHGLSPAERAFLERVASAPGAAEFSTIAHAPGVDYIAAAFVLPLPKTANFASLPMPVWFSMVRAEGLAHIARAALDASHGNVRGAEARLRENIGVGFALMDTPSLIENLIGGAIVRAARGNLVALYDATGRTAEARTISSETDPTASELRLRESAELDQRLSPGDRERLVQSVIGDSTKLRGLRWELALNALAFQPCTDLRQVLFGLDSLQRAHLAAARKALVRYPGEDQLMVLAEEALDRPMSWGGGGPVTVPIRMIRAFAGTVDALSGSKRMTACTSGELDLPSSR